MQAIERAKKIGGFIPPSFTCARCEFAVLTEEVVGSPLLSLTGLKRGVAVCDGGVRLSRRYAETKERKVQRQLPMIRRRDHTSSASTTEIRGRSNLIGSDVVPERSGAKTHMKN